MLQKIREAVTILTLLAVAALAVEGSLLLRQTRKDEVQIAQQTSQTLSNVDRTVIIVGGAATNIEKETREFKDQSVQQAKAATEATQLLNDDLKSFGTLISTANTTLQTQSASLTNLENQSTQTLTNTDKHIDDVFTQLQPALQALSTQTPIIAQNVADISSNANTTSENLADTSLQVKLTATDFQQFVHRETTPVRGTWNLMKGMLEHFAGPAASVATAVK
jgi:uncharacterized protein Yka (UPF0111/DUF47 family)